MLLRIIDIPTTNAAENSIQIVLERNDGIESFIVHSYTSPMSKNFRKTLAWYFSDFPSGVRDSEDGLTVVDKLINVGQYIGDELLGEDHQMIRFKRDIEEQGYHSLRVQIESERLEFFNEHWELAILFESKYVLSTVTQGFSRLFHSSVRSDELPELRYNLHVTSHETGLESLLANGAETVSDLALQQRNSNRQLHVLMCVSRPEPIDLPFASSDALNVSMDAALDEVFNIDICFNGGWDKLENYFKSNEQGFHVFHYDGPVIIINEKSYFTAGNDLSEILSVESLAQYLVKNRVGVLIVDARIFLRDNQQLDASEGLARIAQEAMLQGLGNIVGLGHITNPWFSQNCFNSVYTQIARGFSLEQAVVEARKMLQKKSETMLMTTQPVPFHWWSLLIHYGVQPVVFFDEPQIGLEEKASGFGRYHFHNKLFGFNSDFLPPLFRSVSDGKILNVIDLLLLSWRGEVADGVTILGDSGSGKTQLAHLVCAYLAQKNYVDFAFYFDFSKHNYTRENILEMVAPVLVKKPGDSAETEDLMNQRRCCFVFDRSMKGVCFRKEGYSAEFFNFVQDLIAAGHGVVLISNNADSLPPLVPNIVVQPLLSPTERAVLAAKRLQTFEIENISHDKNWVDLLEASQGNPWLLDKVIPLLSFVDIQKIVEYLREDCSGIQHTIPLKQRFFEWQWAGLPPASQMLLALSSGLNGLLWEMLVAITNQAQVFDPVLKLFALIGCEPSQILTYLDQWHAAGFVRRNPLGRLIDSDAQAFLADKCLNHAIIEDDGELSLLFHQWVCEAICLLARHLGKSPNASLLNYLLHQRGQWVISFEHLWFKQDFRGFIRVKNSFDDLLQQAQLAAESTMWSLDLLSRSPLILPHLQLSSEEVTRDGQLAWLALAIAALQQPEARQTECIQLASEHWRQWIDEMVDLPAPAQLTLYQQASNFLEAFYQSREQWHDCTIVVKKAYFIYIEYQAWHAIVRALKSLAAYSYKLGDVEQTVAFENKIIHDVPYEEAPTGLKAQNLLEILFARISRLDFNAAQPLLDELRTIPDAEHLSEVLDGAQCDIYYQQENYLEALPHYVRLWCRALSTQQHIQLMQLKSRLIDIENKIGKDQFDVLFTYKIPEGTVTPADYDRNDLSN